MPAEVSGRAATAAARQLQVSFESTAKFWIEDSLFASSPVYFIFTGDVVLWPKKPNTITTRALVVAADVSRRKPSSRHLASAATVHNCSDGADSRPRLQNFAAADVSRRKLLPNRFTCSTASRVSFEGTDSRPRLLHFPRRPNLLLDSGLPHRKVVLPEPRPIIVGKHV